MNKIDAHQHFWIYNETDYFWMGPEHAALKRDFTPEDLAKQLDLIGFDGSVVVQARMSIQETEWLLSLSDQYDGIFGVVGWLDLFEDDLQAQVERFAPHEKFNGIRHFELNDPRAEYMLRKDFQHGISFLEPAGLSYDLLLTPSQIDNAIQLVDRFPNQTFVVNHLANPDMAGGVISPWDAELTQMALRRNVSCKLSGFSLAATRDFTLKEFSPYFDIVLESFGPDRVMIGSDWPVSTLGNDYLTVMGIITQYLSSFSSSEQEQLLGKNCSRIYKINI